MEQREQRRQREHKREQEWRREHQREQQWEQHHEKHAAEASEAVAVGV